MQINPTGPLTFWVLITFIATAAVVGIPLLMTIRSDRRAVRKNQEQDIAALVAPWIAAVVKVHNDEQFVHPAALARYALLSEIGSLRTMIETNEQQRREDVRLFREDMKELKQNVARAVGKDG
jgi:hypothetical protein